MPSFKSAAVAAITIFAYVAKGQYYVDPNTVPEGTRDQWCTSQQASCPLLCTQLPGGDLTTAANDCDPSTLTYDCVCGNGQIPNTANYSMTIPYFICTQWVNNCVDACAGQTACQSSCRQDHPCGATNPTRYNITTTTTSTQTASATAGATTESGGVVYNGPGTTDNSGSGSSSSSSSSSSGSNSNGAQSAIALGRSYGLVAVAGGLFAGFALFM